MGERTARKLDEVHVASTPEEREAVFRFRYSVYADELGRKLGGADHDAHRLHDPEDDQPYTTLLYTGAVDNVTGTMRLRFWPPGGVPKADFEMFSMDRFPGIEHLAVGELGRFMIRPDRRGRLVMPALVGFAFDRFVGDHRGDLLFGYCGAGLVPLYRRLGMRPYSGRMISTPDGVHVPLVAFATDRRYFEHNKSPLTSLVIEALERAQRPPLDLSPYAHLLEGRDVPVEFDPSRVWEEVQEAFLTLEARATSLIDGLPEPLVEKLASGGFLMQVEPGQLVTEHDLAERDLFVILGGAFEVESEGRRVKLLGPGEVFGEMAFFRPSGVRSASVRAVSGGRVLVLQHAYLTRLMHTHPEEAAVLLFHLARILAERLAGTLTPG